MVVLVANDAPVLLLAHYVDQGVVRGHEDVAMMLIFFRGLHRGSARTTMSHTPGMAPTSTDARLEMLLLLNFVFFFWRLFLYATGGGGATLG